MATRPSLRQVLRSVLLCQANVQLPYSRLSVGNVSQARTTFASRSTSAKEERLLKSEKTEAFELVRELMCPPNSCDRFLFLREKLDNLLNDVSQRQYKTEVAELIAAQGAKFENSAAADQAEQQEDSKSKCPPNSFTNFTNCELWMKPLLDNMRPSIRRLCQALEVPVSSPALEEELDHRGTEACRFMYDLFNAVTGFTGCFIPRFWGNVEGYDEELNAEEEIRKTIAKFYLGSSHFIGDYDWTILLIGQVHAANALFTEEDMIDAEDYMRIRLREELRCSLTPNLYGAIFIGGRVAFYQMDEKEGLFSRLVNGNPQPVIDSKPTAELWKLVCGDGDEGMKELLRIIMQCWYEVDPDAVQMYIEEKRKAHMQVFGSSPVDDVASDGTIKDTNLNEAAT